LGGSGVLDGAGATGVLIGITTMRFTTVAGTIRGAERFITATASTGEAHAAEPMQGAAEFTTVRARQPGRSTETHAPLADMPNRAGRAACARGPSAVTAMADRPGTFRRAASPASAEEPAVVEAEAAGIDNSVQLRFQAKKKMKFGNGDESYEGKKTEF
jgi:hypothetical protein